MRLPKLSPYQEEETRLNALLSNVLQQIYKGQRLENKTISRVNTMSF